jgi:thiol:disulfide interchange protein DsbD
VIVIDSNTLEVSWRVAPGYYLYKDKTSITITSDLVRAGQPQFPAGEMKYDEFFGESEVYKDDVFVRIPLARASPEPITLDIELAYQGCAEIGICYPPTTRILSTVMPLAMATTDNFSSAPVTEQGRLVKLISEGNLLLVLATFFGAGLLLAFTPCVLPMVPILSGIIAGEGDNISTSRGFTLSLSYVMGMAMVYTAAGIGFAAAGQQAQAVFQQPWILITFAGLFVVLALGMFGLYDLQMPASIQTRLAAVSGKQKSGTMIGAFIMGALSSLIVTACVAPPLVATLTVIGQTGDMLRGGGALFALSMGMGTPLLIVGASAGKLLPKAGPWMSAIKNAFGVMLLGLAIWMLSRLLPGAVTLGLWGVLAFMSGIYLGAMNRLEAGSGNAEKMGKGFGLLALLYGAILLAGAFLGGHDPLRPLSNLNIAGQKNATIQHGLNFKRIKSVDDLDQALTQAATNGQTAMLDFYADWCVSCKEMEAYTFTDEGVQSALENTVLLQADVTANDVVDQALLQRFGVFGPPTIVFFDRDGQQRKGYEVVGYMKAAQFIQHIELTLQAAAPTSGQ